MSKPPTQADLYTQMKQAGTPAARRDAALALLDATRSRDYIDAALRALSRDDVIAILDVTHRPVLRDKALYYFDNADRDRGGLIREQITRLLSHIGHPDDVDLYLRGVTTYHRQPTSDVVQNLRAAALRGLVRHDVDLGSAYAVRLLGEPDTSPLNGEPSLTALGVLAQQGHSLPVYQFVLWKGEEFIRAGLGELTGKALELLAVGLPLPLYTALAEDFLALDAPATTSSLIDAIIENRTEALYSALERVIRETRFDDLHRYAVIALAASRDDSLIALLTRLARISPPDRVVNYIEAVELTAPGSERDTLLRALERRL